MATVGKNILDNLTTGMYSDSKVIYREYIQNACDQIDLAIREGILSADEGYVDIYIDSKKRYISIKDNATGIKTTDFIEDVGDIANSNKEIGKNKGFRGIGRLCGLAYCKTLKFSTSYLGESAKSIMTCDAQKMRAMLIENQKYTLDEIWDAIITYSTEPEAKEEHYFEVEMFDINKENTDLLNDVKVRDYLSFVVPVPYKNTFILRSQIYNHAKSINYTIDEYCVRVNGLPIFKEYTTKLKENRGNYYFVGEVFAVSSKLIPNSQRDYFNENETRVLFEDLLREYFYDVLHKLYYEANRVKNDYKRQEEYLSKVAEYQKKETEQGFVNEEERQRLQFDIDKAKKTAEDARKRLDKFDTNDSTSPLSIVRKNIAQKYEADKLKKQAETTTVTLDDNDKKKSFVTSGMSKLSRSERKLVGKILSIITDIAPKDIAEQIIDKIKEEMR